MASASGAEVEWERVLWKRQPFPDNYVPKTFLSSLSTNANFRPYTYASLVLASCTISLHLAVIFIFLAIFVRLRERTLDPRLLVWISVLSFVCFYTLWEIVEHLATAQSRLANRAKTVKSSILIFLALLALSPVLRTLTAATSSDSIWALAACLFALNVLLADYTPMLSAQQHPRERLSSVLSVNAAIAASVVLASRLADDVSVFALMLLSVEAFALAPLLRRRLQTAPAGFAGLTLLAAGLAVALTAGLSRTVAVLYAAAFAFVTLAAPSLLVWAQRYKNEIRGSWDPAVPKVNLAPHGARPG
ncbi:phosphatidylinositol N-acetylglucosaminyltransferase [Phanerochaete sordida]|uniref:Phosphatidylinositol N-acetylglucosaminyltransferase n=1 Tax=Phanerochaete sordida TaxID=48140 RepID=A0A9P3G103_9APHY|nr:phosphatidylinositol N-acetylglucosaminyltransferase [Phanerochaete sordida]